MYFGGGGGVSEPPVPLAGCASLSPTISDFRDDERRLREPSFVIPEIADFRRQRGTAREREGAFENAVITAEVRYSLVTKHYQRTRPHR